MHTYIQRSLPELYNININEGYTISPRYNQFQICAIGIRRILNLIGSHNNTVSLNDFENNLKKYFKNIVFRDINIFKKKVMENCHYTAN